MNNKPIPKTKKEAMLLRKLHSAEAKVAEMITDFSGSMTFLYVHTVWFAFWILAGHGYLEPLIPAFDPFPYGLLTMIVSLEAIYLATFIMITQNRMETAEELEDIEEEREQQEEEKEQEELEDEVQDIQQDLDDIKSAILTIQQKVESVEKQKPNGNGKKTEETTSKK
ncbi:MAG: DUF1003 domain-containing protein [Candidatus Levyibacteriota bacterium]